MNQLSIAVALALTAAPLAAQIDSAGAGGVPVLGAVWNALRSPARAAWARPLASAVLPGTGQFLGGQARGAVYLIAEAALLVRFFGFRSQARREGNRFRDLALDIARGTFAPAIRDTTFEYFEQMGRFIESGPFDADPGQALTPPSDEETYNGSIWRLARETFFADPDSLPDLGSPEYQRALAFYTRRAIGPNFQWSWRNAGLEQDLFRQTIRDSDEAFRAATRQLGMLLANHVLSAVDAFVTHRLSSTDRSVEVTTAILAAPDGRAGAVMQWRVAF